MPEAEVVQNRQFIITLLGLAQPLVGLGLLDLAIALALCLGLLISLGLRPRPSPSPRSMSARVVQKWPYIPTSIHHQTSGVG